MHKILYTIIGCIVGITIGFISSSLYFKPLLEYKKNGLEDLVKTTIPSKLSESINTYSLKNANIAFHELDYQSATAIIGNEMALTLEALKIGVPQKEVNLTIAMLGPV